MGRGAFFLVFMLNGNILYYLYPHDREGLHFGRKKSYRISCEYINSWCKKSMSDMR